MKTMSLIDSNEIMVSVICTVYNHEKYLRKCLDGFVMQKTNFKFEVLVHDDASTDKSADIIREYEKKYPDMIKPIYQTENQYSQGIKIGPTFLYPKAKGKYFAFCEGDDYWCDETKLQKQFDVMEENLDCSICVHKVINVMDNEVENGNFHPNFELNKSCFSDKEFFNELFVSSYLPFQTSSFFIRKSVFDWKHLPEYWKKCNIGDVPMVLYFIYKGDLFYIDEKMSCYRTHSDGSWTNRIFSDTQKRILHEENLIETFNEYNKFTNYAYSYEVGRFVLMRQFNINQIKGNYKECLLQKYRTCYKILPKKVRMSIVLNAYFPHIMKLYRKIKDKQNG